MMKVGLIGTGGISGSHLKCLKSRPDVEIAALCDLNAESLKKKQEEFGGQAFSDFKEMLEKIKPDAVWLCTPPLVREAPLLACAEAGVPVFCEKPAERDLARAEKITQELKARKAHVQIGYVFRSIPIVQELRKRMQDDKIHLVESFYACGMSLKRASRDWFYDKEKSGGGLVDQATHNLDLLRFLMGEVKQVKGLSANPVFPKKPGYTIEEVIALNFLFKNGSVGSHVHSWVADRWRNEIVLSGEKRLYRLNLGKGLLTVDEGKELEDFSKPGISMYQWQIDKFLDMVQSGDWSGNPCDYEDGMKTLRLTLQCDQAAS